MSEAYINHLDGCYMITVIRPGTLTQSIDTWLLRGVKVTVLTVTVTYN